MQKRSCYIVGKNPQVKYIFSKRGWNTDRNFTESDILIFTGGADITPFLYGERVHKTSQPNLFRDMHEIRLFKESPAFKPKIGICRGGQLLNVLSGGSLWQNVNNHTRSHKLYDVRTGEYIQVTSTHHQMMLPNELGEILAVAGLSTVKESDNLKFDFAPDSDDPESWEDAEVVWYEHTKALCFQAHPEYGLKECEDYFFRLIDELIVSSLDKKGYN